MASITPVYRIKQPTGFKSGAISVGTTPIQGPALKVAAGHQVVLQAPYTNTESVWVGDADVAVGAGAEIPPGGGLMVSIDDLSKLYFIASSPQTIYYACEVE